jgi:uncharacterized protein
MTDDDRAGSERGDGAAAAAGPAVDQQDGSMGIFTSREAAEEFVPGDPFVLHG